MYSPWFLILGKLGRKNPVDHFREPETMSLELPAMDAATCTQADHELVRQSELEAGCFFSMRQNGGVFLLQSVTVCICSSHFAGCQGLTGVAQAHPHPMAHLEVIETSITRWVMLFGCIICHGLKGRGKGCRQQTTSLISCTILYQEAEWFLSTACRNTMKHPQRSIKQFRSLETTDDTAEISKGGSPDSLEGFVEALCCQWVWYFFSTSSTVSWLLQGHLEDLNRMASKPLWHGFGHAPSLFLWWNNGAPRNQIHPELSWLQEPIETLSVDQNGSMKICCFGMSVLELFLSQMGQWYCYLPVDDFGDLNDGRNREHCKALI